MYDMKSMKNVKIMAWNANGIIQHQNELELLLHKEKIDICLISETHLTKQMYITFQGYNMYCSNHPLENARGGSAIIIKKSIHHFEDEKIRLTEFQAVAVCIKLSEADLTVIALYSPPRHNLKSEDYKKLFENYNGRYIIGGDFNAKHVSWGSRLTTPKGRELWKAAKQLGCQIISTGSPTYWPSDPNKIPDVIDFFVVKQIPNHIIQVEDGVDLNSDHSPIFMYINGKSKFNERSPVLSNKMTDWNFFKYKLDTYMENTDTITNEEDIEDETIKLTTHIQKAAWISTPASKQTRDNHQQRYPQEILEILGEKRKVRKKWQSTRVPSKKTELNRLTKLLREKIQEHKNNIIKNTLKNLSAEKAGDSSLWNAMTCVKRPIQHNPLIKQQNGIHIWAKSDAEKADVFANHLQKIFQPHRKTINFTPPSTVQEFVKIKHFSIDEVATEISNLKLRKSPGFDLITAEVLRNISTKALMKLTFIMNACLDWKYIPFQWKVSEIVMIPKPGKNPNEVSSYRPIALLPVMGKLFEKLFSKRLKSIIACRNIIPSHQFGFREKHSTVEQIHRITHTIEDALESNKVCSAIFLDVAQAFDKVWHEGLLCKLKALLPMQFTDILESYITNRYFRVKQKQAYSEIKQILAGVPQGSILGPVLYLLYTADLPVPKMCKVATFADDTCILAVGSTENESIQKLQKSIDEVVTWTENWNIKLNETKSVHVDFTNKKIIYKPVHILSAIVPNANSAKYLGMTLDVKLKWKEHVKIKAAELNLKTQKLQWLIGRNSELSTQNKLLIYNQVLKPVWTYGLQLWGCTAKTNIDIIQRLQNRVIRGIVKAPWYVRNEDLHKGLNLKTVSDTANLCAVNHAEKLKKHINAEASVLSDEATVKRRLKRKKPQDLVVNIV